MFAITNSKQEKNMLKVKKKFTKILYEQRTTNFWKERKKSRDAYFGHYFLGTNLFLIKAFFFFLIFNNSSCLTRCAELWSLINSLTFNVMGFGLLVSTIKIGLIIDESQWYLVVLVQLFMWHQDSRNTFCLVLLLITLHCYLHIFTRIRFVMFFRRHKCLKFNY